MINSSVKIKKRMRSIKINYKIIKKKKLKILRKNDIYLREGYDLIFIIYII